MLSDTQKLVIVDTDPGVDDAMALLFLKASIGVSIHSITTVFGNADVKTTTKNAAYLTKRFGISAPVFSGANQPITRKRHIPELRVHGNDGYGDTGVANSHTFQKNDVDAASHIINTIKKNPHRITLLGLAPLTNFALALQKAPEIADLVADVVVMGGAFGGKGRHGNIQKNAEANIFYDPEAADIVFASHWPVTVIGLDVTSDCILPAKTTRKLAQTGGDAGFFLWEISRGYEKIYHKFDGIDGCCIHDVAAAAYVVNPDYFVTDRRPIKVELSGNDTGHTVVLDGGSNRPLHKIGRSVQADKVISAYAKTIETYSDIC